MKRNLYTILFLLTPYLIFAQCYNLVWADEFNGSTLDATKWTYQTGASGWGNNELQYYTDRTDNAYVSGGSLKIEAKSESYMGANYTSARIRSINQGDWTYGKMEASIKLPEGQGIWPAFWMMPTESVYGIWPASGEIDIMEYLGHQTDRVYATCHYGNTYLDKSSSGSTYVKPTGNYNDGAFHTFTVEWEPTQIRWYVDGTQFHTFNAGDESPYHFPFDQDFHFILNVAVGGNWPGNPDGTTMFPQIMEVDYVRVYQELDDIDINGEITVEPTANGVTYAVPNISGTTYNWSVPSGATLASGQGTHEIDVDWGNGNSSGNIQVTMTNACGTATRALGVTVTPNLTPNPGFEQDFSNWQSDLFNGASASFSINTSDVRSGSKSMCVNVSGVGPDTWNIQISPADISLTNGESYTIHFWAKADVPNRQMSMAVINASTFAYYTGNTYTLSDNWQFFSHTFNATATAIGNINMQFGHETGTFCLDDFLFARTAVLPIELVSFQGRLDGRQALLNWETASESEFSHFLIEKSNDGKTYETIGRIESLNQADGAVYSFVDSDIFEHNYYRLKAVDLDGTYEYSHVIYLETNTDKTLHAYPNPTSNTLNLNWEMKGETFSYEIWNGIGQRILQGQTNESSMSIDMSSLECGIYYLKLMNENGQLMSTQIIKG